MQAPAKPDPTGISHLLSIWDTTPDQAIMIGDYLFDLQAGKTAGTATIHVNQSTETNWANLTDIRVKTLSEIVDLFLKSHQSG